MASTFAPARDQDASPTIRGFVYQANLTILRWLRLPADASLQLECGEDIDLVAHEFRTLVEGGAPEEFEQRLLEQVKHLDKNITLRHPAALKAIADFTLQLAKNPMVGLRYRLTTNAAPGVERPPAFPELNESAIELWRALAEGRTPDGKTENSVVEAIAKILRGATQPENVDDEDWKKFQDAIAANAAVTSLIKKFEWSVRTTEHADLPKAICEELTTSGRARPETARTKYERLFAHVLSVLSEPGAKVLTKEGLAGPLSEAPLSSFEQALFTAVSSRVTLLEKSVQRIDAQVQQLAQSMKADVSITVATQAPRITPPQALTRRTTRSKTVSDLVARLGSNTWLALHGPIGAGKSEMASLVGERLGRVAAWVRFREIDPRLAPLRLSRTLELLSSGAVVVGKGDVVVLDDLPLVGKGELAELVLELVSVCHSVGARLITTSGVEPPEFIRDRARAAGALSAASPPFSVEDAKELLSAFGMPSVWTETNVKFVVSCVAGHPALVSAAAFHLARTGWKRDDEFLATMLHGKFGDEVNDDTIRRLTENVAKDETAELLFRLKEVVGEFAQPHVDALAQLEKPVVRANERLIELSGLFIQSVGGGAYEVSPLIKRISSQLSPASIRRANSALAQLLIEEKSLDQIKGTKLLGYLCKAEEWDRAGLLMMQAYSGAPAELRTKDIFLGFWAGVALPAEMSPAIRMAVRGLQLKRATDASEVKLYVADLRTIEPVIDANGGWSLGYVIGTAGHIIAKVDYELAVQISCRALLLLSTLSADHPLNWSVIVDADSIVFVPLIECRDFSAANKFLQAFARLPRDLVAKASSARMATRAFEHLGRLPWTSRVGAGIAFTDGRWGTALTELDALHEKGKELDLPWLRVWASASAVVVLCEVEGKFADGVARGKAALTDPALNDEQRSVLEECIGRQYLYAGKTNEAVTWLEAAVARPATSFPDTRVQALLALSKATSDTAPDRAVSSAKEAIDFSKLPEGGGPTHQVRAIGEAAIAIHRRNGAHAAFPYVNEAVEILLANADESREWRWLGRQLMHVALCMWQGEAAGVPAKPGFMLTPLNPAIATEKLGGTRPDVLTVVANLAEHVGEDARASELALLSLYAGTKSGSAIAMQMSAGPKAMAGLLLAGRLAEALDVALVASRAFIAVQELDKLPGGFNKPLAQKDAFEVLGARGKGAWPRVDSVALEMFLIPAAMALGLMWLKDPGAAAREARALAVLLKQQAGEATNAATWNAAARLLEAAFTEPVNHQALVDEAARHAGVVQGFGYLLATLTEELSIETCVKLHRDVVRWMEEAISKGSPLLTRAITVTFVEQYWTTRFARSRFRFPAARVVEAGLDAARKEPAEKRAQAILAALVA